LGAGGAELFFDTHAHLSDPTFDEDRDAVIGRALAAGVEGILAVSVDLASSERSLDIARRNPQVRCAVGVHPSESERFAVDAPGVRRLLTRPEVRAVGEIGLDYYRCSAPRHVQMEVFRTQVGWAVDAGLPVVIHDREAHDDVMKVVAELRPRGVLHCFSGNDSQVTAASRLGMYISLAGNVTYKNAGNLAVAAQSIPLPLLLTETDSPYLSPQSCRGKRNEPANIALTAEWIADLRGMKLEDVGRQTSRNARSLLSWGAEPEA